MFYLIPLDKLSLLRSLYAVEPDDAAGVTG